MRQKNNILGEFNEVLIANFLEGQGQKILELRFKGKNGEIDVISSNDESIIFTEVKYRKHFEDFEGIVNNKKLECMVKTAESFVSQNSLEHLNQRFDVIFIDNYKNINHLQNVLS